jgi:hypothetical protein
VYRIYTSQQTLRLSRNEILSNIYYYFYFILNNK